MARPPPPSDGVASPHRDISILMQWFLYARADKHCDSEGSTRYMRQYERQGYSIPAGYASELFGHGARGIMMARGPLRSRSRAPIQYPHGWSRARLGPTVVILLGTGTFRNELIKRPGAIRLLLPPLAWSNSPEPLSSSTLGNVGCIVPFHERQLAVLRLFYHAAIVGRRSLVIRAHSEKETEALYACRAAPGGRR